MKTICFQLMLLCLWNVAAAQVSGKITDTSGQPVPFATAALIQTADSSIARSSLSGDSGQFKLINPLVGKYLLRVSSIGFQTWNSPVFALTADSIVKDFGSIVLKANAKELSAVVISGARPLVQQTSGGIVVNAEKSVLSKGSSVLAILERSPGVVIDHQNNDIVLNGKTGVMVMIDGKQVRMPISQLISMLDGMSGDQLSKIELLTTPGASYDAEGSAGLINLILKKNRKSGTSGSLTLGTGYGYGEKADASVNIEHTAENTTVYGSYSSTHDKSYTDFTAVGNELEPLLGGQAASVFTSVSKTLSNNHNLVVGIDTRTGAKTSMGGSINYLLSNVSVPTVNTGSYRVQPDSLYLLNAVSTGTDHWRSIIGDYYIRQDLGKSARLNFTTDYLDYRNDYPTTVSSSFLSSHGYPAGSNDTLFSPAVKTYSNTRIRVGVAQADLTQQFGTGMKLESGLKGTYTQTSSVSGIESLVNGAYVLQPSAINDMVMKEYIAAGYSSLTAQLDTSWKLVAGLRYEYSATRMNQVPNGKVITDRKLSELFPNVSLTGQLNKNDELDLSYTRRISRPSYTDLASFITYNGPTSVNTGNPLLLPTTTDNFRLGFRSPGYSLALLYSRDNNPIVRYQLIESPDHTQLEVAPENMVYQDNLTLQAGVPFSVGSFWDMNYDLAGGWRKFKEDFTPEPAEKAYFSYSLHSSQTFKLPQKWLIELSGYYNGPNYIGSRKYDGYGVLNLGFRKTLGNNKGSFQFSVDDLLESGALVSYFGSLTEEAFNLKSRVIHEGEASKCRIFRLSYTRSFGKNPALSKNKPDLQDEKGRVGN